MRTYKFRIYPTKQQNIILDHTIETCRHLYNDSLGERKAGWDVGFYEQKQLLTLRKQDNKYYKQVHSQVLQDVLLRLDKAYQSFFKKIGRYPKFKRRKKYNSFTYPQHGGFQIKQNRLVLSKIGAIRLEMHRTIEGVPKTCTIIHDVDKWYCCITADTISKDIVSKHDISKHDIQRSVGVDLGLLNWITLSDGKVIQNTFDFKTQAGRIKQLQRNLARKKKGSHNREKAKVRLARVWQKTRMYRYDYVHKTSRKLADNYDLIVFEKLNIQDMTRNHNLAHAIMDATWGKLRLFTAYKAEGRGAQTVTVNPCGTSQKCSRCGVVAKEKIGLGVRVFECASCGNKMDRDHNAACNILNLGLEQAHAERQPILVRQRISKFVSMKQETHEFTRG